jgi:hypothetical protein
MRFRTALSLVTLFMLCFTAAVWTEAATPPFSKDASATAADTEPLAGKISAIGDASFSVDIVKDKNVNTVQFMIDANTTVEGKLAVGAQASVEYRAADGKNIATHVVVTPASGTK